jgi:O-antigen/teichoic acid export membrane protein
MSIRRSSPARGGAAAILVIGLRSLALAVTILTGLVSAALLGASGRGVLAALLTGPAFLSGVCSMGLHAAVIYRMKEKPEDAQRYFGTALLLVFGCGSAAIAIGWVLTPLWLHKYDADTIWYGRLLLLTLPLTMATWTMTGAAESQGWFTFANGTLYLQNCAVLLFLGLLAWAHAITPVTAAFAYAAPTVPVFIYFLVRMLHRVKPDFRFRLWHTHKLLHYGIRLYGVDLLNTFLQYSDQLIAVTILPAHLVGAYSVAQSIARLPNVISTGVSSVLFPAVAARQQAHVLEKVALSFRLVTLVSAVASVCLAVVGPTLLLLIYGPSFAPAITPMRILLVATTISNGTAILYQAYAASGRPGFVTICEALGLLTSLPLMALLAARYGADGVAAAVLIAAILRATSATAGLSLVLHASFPRLLPDTSDVRRLSTACAQMLARAVP